MGSQVIGDWFEAETGRAVAELEGAAAGTLSLELAVLDGYPYLWWFVIPSSTRNTSSFLFDACFCNTSNATDGLQGKPKRKLSWQDPVTS